MFQQLLHIIFISVVCVIWGLPVIIAHFRKINLPIGREEIILSFFTGLSMISLFGAWICLFFSLIWTIAAIATILPLIVAIILIKKNGTRFLPFKRSSLSKRNNLILLVLAFLSVALFLILGSNSPAMIDTGLYHLQIIRWNHEYGTTTGLANLFPRYGFYSNWLSLISLFALPFKNENFLYLNSTLAIWFLFFLIHKISFHLYHYHSSKEHAILSWSYVFIMIIMFIEWRLFRAGASSTSYDFIVTCITLLVLLLILEDYTSTSFFSSIHLLPLIIMSASVPFFKLSGATIVIILLTYFILTKKKKSSYLSFAGILTLFTLPFLYRNYLQTGYPVFPYSFFSWGTPDWQVPLNMTNRIAHYISLNNKYFNQPIPEAEWINPSLQWIKSWFTYIPVTDKVIVLLAVAGLPVFILYVKQSLQKAKHITSMYAACFIPLFVWFILSPDPRFAYGYLLFAAAFPLSLLARKFMSQKSILFFVSVLCIGIVVYGAGKFNTNNIITPERLTIPGVTSTRINNVEYNIPVESNENGSSRCYYSLLPCIYQINPYLEQRGDSIKDGFRMNKNIDSLFIINYRY